MFWDLPGRVRYPYLQELTSMVLGEPWFEETLRSPGCVLSAFILKSKKCAHIQFKSNMYTLSSNFNCTCFLQIQIVHIQLKSNMCTGSIQVRATIFAKYFSLNQAFEMQATCCWCTIFIYMSKLILLVTFLLYQNDIVISKLILLVNSVNLAYCLVFSRKSIRYSLRQFVVLNCDHRLVF